VTIHQQTLTPAAKFALSQSHLYKAVPTVNLLTSIPCFHNGPAITRYVTRAVPVLLPRCLTNCWEQRLSVVDVK